MFFVVFNGCITPSHRHADIVYNPEFKIESVGGETMVCQRPKDVEALYKKLAECKDAHGR